MAAAAVRRASKWISSIEGVAGICDKLSAEAIRGNALLRRDCVESCNAAIRALRDLLSRIKE